MRVSFVDDEPEIYPLQYGGKARTIMNLASNLIELADVEEVRILSRSIDDSRDLIEHEGVLLEKLDDDNMIGRIVQEVDDVDIVNVHTCSFTLPRIAPRKAALVYHLHDVMLTTADRGSHLDKALAGDWDAIVAPSEFAAQTFRNFATITGGAGEVHTIPRGVNTELFQPVPKQAAIDRLGELGVVISEQTGPILFVPNRPGAGKGEDYLTEISSELAGKYPDFLIITTGDPTPDASHPNVQHVGWQATETLKYFYSVADITLCLSKLPESFSQVAVESVACGTPVISSGFGNLSELSKNFAAIKSCQPTADSIKRQIHEVLDNPDSTTQEVEQSRLAISQRFNENAITTEYLLLYRRLLAAKGSDVEGSRAEVFFVSPFINQFGLTVYRGNYTTDAAEVVEITQDESRVLEACRVANSIDSIRLTTGLEGATIVTNLKELTRKRLIIRGRYDQ